MTSLKIKERNFLCREAEEGKPVGDQTGWRENKVNWRSKWIHGRPCDAKDNSIVSERSVK